MLITPVEAVYKASGDNFIHPSSTSLQTPVECVRCLSLTGTDEPTVLLKNVASNKFTDWDRLTSTSDEARLCNPCAWAYSNLQNRLNRILVTEDQVHPLSSLEASNLLMYQDTKTIEIKNASIVVPVSGKKHVLPYAEWGTLVYDDGNLSWNPLLSQQIASIFFLKQSGLSENSVKNKVHYYPGKINPKAFFYAWETIEESEPLLLNLLLVLARTLCDRVLEQSFGEMII